MRTSSARSKVSELGFSTGRWFIKYLSAWRPSLLGITVYKDIMSIVKMILFSPENLKARKISSAWLLSLIYEGSDLTKVLGVVMMRFWAVIGSSCLVMSS